jgi:hypothetical protein
MRHGLGIMVKMQHNDADDSGFTSLKGMYRFLVLNQYDWRLFFVHLLEFYDTYLC